jgi:hypothetical protein
MPDYLPRRPRGFYWDRTEHQLDEPDCLLYERDRELAGYRHFRRRHVDGQYWRNDGSGR